MMEFYTTSDGVKMGVENGRRFRIDEEELCLAQTHPDSGVWWGSQFLFADGSSKEQNGGIHKPPPAGGQYPLHLPTAIRTYWRTKFQMAEAEFKKYKRGISEGYYLKSKEVLAELQRLKAVAQGCAKEIRKAEAAVEKADPSYRQRSEADRRAEVANQQRQHEFMKEVKSIELNV